MDTLTTTSTEAASQGVMNGVIAFAGETRIASGDARTVAAAAKAHVDADPTAMLQIFDATTSHRIEWNLHGSLDDVLNRLSLSPLDATTADVAEAPTAAPGAGRPKLGVVAREVTLLPRHWDWLGRQPGGASVALRKLVEEARRANAEKDRVREAQESVFRFLNAMAGNLRGFEEANRALFAGNSARFAEVVVEWPGDVREQALALAQRAFGEE